MAIKLGVCVVAERKNHVRRKKGSREVKLKDLIGIIPNRESIDITDKYRGIFDEIDFDLLNKEVVKIDADSWDEGVLQIEIRD